MDAISMKRRKPTTSRNNAKDAEAAVRESLALGDLNYRLGYFLRRLQVWVFQDFIETLRPMKVRPAQYSVLLVIEANPGHSQTSIGQILGIERARLARLLHELERRQWVTRRGAGGDGRSHALKLTVNGEVALAKIKHLAEQHESHLAAYVGAKRHRQLIDLLREFG
jgi:DNA-binding MarR family transcriptional regulator